MDLTLVWMLIAIFAMIVSLFACCLAYSSAKALEEAAEIFGEVSRYEPKEKAA